MSLKAKIEAVIYASEEPVTLAQLIGLLGQEGQVELDRAAEAQPALAFDESQPATEPTLPDESSSLADEEFAATAAPEPAPTEAAPAEATAAPEESSAQTGDQTTTAGLEEVPTESAETPAEPPAIESAAEPSEAELAAAASKAEKARTARLRTYFRGLLDQLITEYSSSDRGLEIREIAGGFRFATKPEYHDTVRGFVKSLKPPLKLSLQALETLAVVAYKQPVTAPEISEIRGVDSGGVLGSLISRKLITTAGRKQVIGRPILYKTTKEFLLKFGLKDLSELPSIEEFEKMAGQLAEQEEMAMPDAADPRPNVNEAAEKLESERDDHSPQPDGDSTEPSAADNVSEETGDKASVDGRISSLPPDYEGEERQDNPSAEEAEVQSGE
jgi:segregation and condensation protein B